MGPSEFRPRAFHCRSDGRVTVSAAGALLGAGGWPASPPGVVSAASVQPVRAVKSAPDDLSLPIPLPSGSSRDGRVSRASRCPATRSGVIPAAGVQPVRPSNPPHTIISAAQLRRVARSCGGALVVLMLPSYLGPDFISPSVHPVRAVNPPTRSFRCRSRRP
jgi:hypothetical protein